MTADEGASLAQSKTHEEVRDDIADSDIQQVVETLNAALTVPYIRLNFGEQAAYPKIDLFKPDEKNVEQIIEALENLGDKGLTVKADEVRSLLGLSKPETGDEVVGGRGTAAVLDNDGLNAAGISLNAAQGESVDELDALTGESDYTLISDDIAAVLEKAADAATDFTSFQKELQKLVSNWTPDKIAECIAVATFKSRALGAAEFDSED
jgi:phage gp29-like protein